MVATHEKDWGRFKHVKDERIENTFEPKISRKDADTLRRLAQRWSDARVELMLAHHSAKLELQRLVHKRRHEYQQYINVLLYGHTPTERLYPSSSQGATNSSRS